jgi:diguanylate cyclase (GGDEF)-like protein
MRKERLTYRDLLRRILAGRLLRLEERRRAEDILGIPDLVEVALRLRDLLDSVAARGALIAIGRRPDDRGNVRRYLDPATNDTWVVELPGPAVLPPAAPAAAVPAPAPAPVPRAEPPAPREAAAVAAEPPAPPRIVRPVEALVVDPAVARRFANDAGEPLRTLCSAFAPCRTPEELADALAPLRDQVLRCTTATDLRFHILFDPQSGLTPVPLWGQQAAPHLALGGRVADLALAEGKVLHVPDLAAPGTDAPPSERGALATLPLVSGERTVGLVEVRRDEGGAFAPDELALFALTASVAAGSLVRAEILEKLIFLDRLTGLWNRGYFDDQIEREIERANRMGTSLALLMADVDHFKRINDRYGHQVGDHALVHVSAIIRSNIRQIDVAARYGGEEFAVLLPSITRARAARTAERLRRVVADTRFAEVIPELGDARLSISLGFALYPDDAATAKQLVDRADRVALYAAKSRGRNRVVPWSAAPDGPAIESPPGA